MGSMSSRLEIRVSEELKERLERIAEEKGMSVSEIIRDLIKFYIESNIDIKHLIEEALKNPVEAKYILQLETWYRQGPSYRDNRDYEVIFGDADIILLEEINEGYPYRRIEKYVIIPKDIPVIIRVREFCDIPGSERDVEEIYIFTKDGWKKVEIK